MRTELPDNAVAVTKKEAIPGVLDFAGFKAPTSNTTYTPNQLFDVVLPHFSRGVVRIVAYLIRKTLGWCDADGNPQEEQVQVTYSELERKAGVSRDMIRPALDDALAGKIIECVREGRPKLAGDAGQSALYQLRWSDAPYTTRPQDFTGFFEGEGNRTDIPNEFFDVVVPREPLIVTKVVGSIIRHSIGFQAKHGRRRQQVALSYQHIQNYARVSCRRDLAKAIRTSIERRYIIRLEEGVFSPYGHEQRRATYALRWCDLLIGRKNTPAPDRSEIPASIGQKNTPADRSEIHPTIETKPIKETLNGQPAADPELFEKLTATGFSEKTAAKLMREHPEAIICRQLEWLPHRAPARSPAGLLRRAIEQDWPAPAGLRTSEVVGTSGWEFARHFYAAFAGNRGEPVNEPSAREAELAGAFVQRLLKLSPGEQSGEKWGRTFGRLAREQRHPFPSLSLAIRQLGDAFLVQMEKQRLHAQLERTAQAREAHEAQYRPAWLAWLAGQEAELKASQPDDYARFVSKRERDYADLTGSRTPWAAAMLTTFHSEGARLHAFRQFFGLPDFWAWDAEINSHRFELTESHT
jgi:hypothetical protein